LNIEFSRFVNLVNVLNFVGVGYVLKAHETLPSIIVTRDTEDRSFKVYTTADRYTVIEVDTINKKQRQIDTNNPYDVAKYLGIDVIEVETN